MVEWKFKLSEHKVKITKVKIHIDDYIFRINDKSNSIFKFTYEDKNYIFLMFHEYFYIYKDNEKNINIIDLDLNWWLNLKEIIKYLNDYISFEISYISPFYKSNSYIDLYVVTIVWNRIRLEIMIDNIIWENNIELFINALELIFTDYEFLNKFQILKIEKDLEIKLKHDNSTRINYILTKKLC